MHRQSLPAVLVLALAVSGCSTEDPPKPGFGTTGGALSSGKGGPAPAPAPTPSGGDLHSYIHACLEVDQLGAAPPADANLVRPPTSEGDGSGHAQKPAGGVCATLPFLDWHDLVSLPDHRLLDLDDPALGADPTSFPGSNECVGPSHVLEKMDLTYVAVANNQSYAYIAVQRAANSGDAGYYWLFTRKLPNLDAGLGEAPCKATERRLTYDVTAGDVLLVGHFHPGSTPLVQAFRATADRAHVTAVSAVNYLDATLWADQTAAVVAAAAVNTTVTNPGSFGAAGVKNMKGQNLGIELFAEAAINLQLFTGSSQSICDTTYYASVITRSSGAGGTSPDLKDLAGPAYVNFGKASATASLKPTCQGIEYSASVLGSDGKPASNPSCTWTFSDGSTATGCTGVLATSASGAITGTVTTGDPLTGCGAQATTEPVDVHPGIQVTAEAKPACDLGFQYSATVTGGLSPQVSWSFEGPGDVGASAGTASVTAAGTYSVKVHVTDVQDGVTCEASASATVTPHPKVEPWANLTPTCGLQFGYAGGAQANGGEIEGALCSWTFDGGGAATDCTGQHAVGPGSYGGSLTVTDPTTWCTGTIAAAPVAVHPELAVVAALSPTCSLQLAYGAQVTGGSNPAGTQLAWTFAGGGAVSPTSASGDSGLLLVATAGVAYDGHVVATDVRDGITCTAEASASSTPVGAMSVTVAPLAAPGVCPDLATDQVTFAATVLGGVPPYHYSWSVAGCGDSPTCTVAPPAGNLCEATTVAVQVIDSSGGLCPSAVSPPRTYTKITTIAVD